MAYTPILYFALISSGLGILTHQDDSLTLIDALKKDLPSLEKCLKENNEDLTEVVKKTHSCFDKVLLHIHAVENDADVIKQIITTYCSKPDFTCFTSIKNALQMCLPKFQQALKLFDGALKYACQDDGQPIKDILSDSGRHCINSQRLQTQQCVVKASRENAKGLDSWFEQNFCQDQLTFFKCWTSALNTCEDKTAFRVSDSLFKSMYKDTPCASCGLFANYILLLFTFLILVLQ
uniref:Uncharacterized protein n=1 Tax=Strigamia maritima TaxID=126957 RepID=T1IHN1_STRMM